MSTRQSILMIWILVMVSGQLSMADQPKGGSYICSVFKNGNSKISPIGDMRKPIDFSLPENQIAGSSQPPYGVAFAESEQYIIYVNETEPANDPYPSKLVIYSVAKFTPQATISMAMGYTLSHQSLDFLDGVSKASVSCEKQ